MDHMQVNMAEMENAHPTDPRDSMQDGASPHPPTPERIRHIPEWEVPTNPPKHRRRGSDSLFGRLLQIPTALTIPSPTITLPDALKRHQTTLSPRPKTLSRGRSAPINKNDISSPFGFVHTSTGNPSPISSVPRLQDEPTQGSPTGSGPLLPTHNAGPGYVNASAVSSPTISTLSPSPASTPLYHSQTQRHDHIYDQESQRARGHDHTYHQEVQPSPDHDHVYDQDDQDSQQAPDEKAARITSEQPSQHTALSPVSIFPRIKNHFSSNMTSAALPPPPLDSGSRNPHTPSNQSHSPRALGFLGSSPPNANRDDRGHQRYESAGNPTLESGGYGSRESQMAEKPLFPMNLPPKRRRMLYIIIPLSTILLLALILGLGLGLGLRSRFDDSNRLSRGGASNGDNDWSGNLGSGNDGSSTFVVPSSTPTPDLSSSTIPTSAPETSTIPIPTDPNSTPIPKPTPSPNPNTNSSPIPEPSASPDSSSSIGPRPDAQPTVLPPTLPSTLYPAPESSPAPPESSISKNPASSPTPESPNPAESSADSSPSPEPTPRPNDPASTPTPVPVPAPPEDPNEPYQPKPYDPAPPQVPGVPQYGNPNPDPNLMPSPTNGNTIPDDGDNDTGNGNGNGNGSGPSPTTGTGTGGSGSGSGNGSGDAPKPQPAETAELPLPPPFSTNANVGPFKGNLLAYNAVGVGACGEIHTDDDIIGAIAWEVFDAVSTLAAGDASLLLGGAGTGTGSDASSGCAGAASKGSGDSGASTRGGTGGGGSTSPSREPGEVNCGGRGGAAANPLGNPNDNPLCGRKVRVFLNRQGAATGSGIIVRIVDRCTSCLPNDLGLSPGAFATLGDEYAVREGKANGLWEWVVQ